MRHLTTILILTIITTCFSQTLIIDDPLTNGKSDVGTSIGSGTFTTEGYQPGAFNHNLNHILYEVPAQIESGYLEFQIKGMTNDGGSATDSEYDPGFCGMYDGRGINEPIAYFDDFKHNYFRWNVHWRGDRKKIKAVIICAEPTSERLNATKAVFTGGDRDWDSEPTGQAMDWDPSTWYTIKVEWKDKTFKVYIDGVEKWSTSGPYHYLPVDHKIWIGCAPGYSKKYTATVPGLTFRNVKLYSFKEFFIPEITRITINGTDFNGFDAKEESQGFEYELPEGNKDIPVLNIETNDPEATIVEILPKDLTSDNLSDRAHFIDITFSDGSVKSLLFSYNKVKEVEVDDDNQNSGTITQIGSSKMDINLYPNPTNDYVVIQNINKIHAVSIYNSTGVLMYQNQAVGAELKINVSYYLPGVYMLVTNSEKGNREKHILIIE